MQPQLQERLKYIVLRAGSENRAGLTIAIRLCTSVCRLAITEQMELCHLKQGTRLTAIEKHQLVGGGVSVALCYGHNPQLTHVHTELL
jgi:hypothetical protein